MGERIGRKLIELDPDHDGFHVLLSNIYASKGNWDDVHEIREIMVQHGVNFSGSTKNWKGRVWHQHDAFAIKLIALTTANRSREGLIQSSRNQWWTSLMERSELYKKSHVSLSFMVTGSKSEDTLCNSIPPYNDVSNNYNKKLVSIAFKESLTPVSLDAVLLEFRI
ncbi:pentatricopeptide repeat-containing protein [Prunus yedoensis var. nudiflora]|uniref:Pentatricopeptide repeat-containing protein n=1 Tax=Prunus yedoensis var. nudiflora TaxID=2094558 RepID=A0A314YWP2_PRUYE|nr:pentatricopeptide repeat-containing protein [Prunus yedoensis var. nudiflora]